MKRAYRLAVEVLESRLTPAAFGFPWPGNHLTLSFVPDGTLVGGLPSQLFSALNAAMPTSVWEGQILRAFQTWAASANLNISVVADDGEPLGAPGPMQGSPNFGDIRIAAVSGGSSLATGIPFTPGAGTWSGDVIFNSNIPFGVGSQAPYDLFSVALHEAGHTLGIDDNLDSSSAMFSYYSQRSGLSDTDIQSIQSLYGARPADSLEGPFGNNTKGTATPFSVAALVQYIGQITHPAQVSSSLPALAVNADISTASDVDYYSYSSIPFNPGFTVQLHTSGISSLDARVTVFDWKGQALASATASDPMHGDLSLRVDGVHGKLLFYIAVQGATGDVMSVGGYQLQIVPDSVLPLLPFRLVDFIGGLLPPPNNHGLATATALQDAATTTNDRFDFTANGRIGSSGAVDYYSLVAPQPPAGQPESMTVMVWGRSGSTLNPSVTVYDAGGNQVTADLVESGDGSYIVRVPNAQPGARYYVAVQAPAGATGAYFLGVDVSTRPDSSQTLTTGQLGATAPGLVQQDFRSVVLQQNMLFHLDFSAQSPTATVQTAVEVTLFDMNGTVLGDWTVHNGEHLSVNLYLPAGSYTFRFVGGTQDGSLLPPTTYTVSGYPANDPIGPALVPPITPPPPPIFPFEWLQTGLYRLLALVDPYGHPLPIIFN